MNLIENAKQERERLTKEYNDRTKEYNRMLDVLDGVIAGRKLISDVCYAGYSDEDQPNWCQGLNYRLAPEPKWRPWTLREAFEKEVCSKTDSSLCARISGVRDIFDQEVFIEGLGINCISEWITLERLHKDYIQPDGSPCGVKVEG